MIQKNKIHLLIGVLSGLWLYFFLVLVAPYDLAQVRFVNRVKMMPGYAVILSFTYISFVLLQQKLKGSLFKNKIYHEIFAVGYVFFIALLPSFFYYKSDFILGEYSFNYFFFNIYIPLQFLILPILFILRKTVVNQVKKSEKITIQGAGKYDMISLWFSDLIFIKSCDNYVEVNYAENNQLKVKLIRTNLKNIKSNFPELVQTHRSYLVNPLHFISWNSRKNISVTLSKVPVSDRYRKDVLKMNEFDHK